MGGLLGSVEGEKCMSIHWETYQKTHKFSLLEAAFLWLEIKPTKEDLESPPYCVEARRKLLNDEINHYIHQLVTDDFYSLLKSGLSEEEAIDEFLRLPNKKVYQVFLMGLTEHQKLQEEERSPETPITQRDHYYTYFEYREIKEINSITLKEIAKTLNERPKFLFREEIKKLDSERQKSDEGKWNGVRKSSYRKLINFLFKEAKLDINDINIVSAIQLKAQTANIEVLDDDTLRSLLDEVEPSRLNNTNRRRKPK
jgi:hypothetical protein